MHRSGRGRPVTLWLVPADEAALRRLNSNLSEAVRRLLALMKSRGNHDDP
jgi:hypothetical protein